MLLGQISHDPLHPDFVPSIFAHVDVGSREKLKRKLDRYFQTTATKRKRLETVARTVETPPGELCVAFKIFICCIHHNSSPRCHCNSISSLVFGRKHCRSPGTIGKGCCSASDHFTK